MKIAELEQKLRDLQAEHESVVKHSDATISELRESIAENEEQMPGIEYFVDGVVVFTSDQLHNTTRYLGLLEEKGFKGSESMKWNKKVCMTYMWKQLGELGATLEDAKKALSAENKSPKRSKEAYTSFLWKQMAGVGATMDDACRALSDADEGGCALYTKIKRPRN